MRVLVTCLGPRCARRFSKSFACTSSFNFHGSQGGSSLRTFRNAVGVPEGDVWSSLFRSSLWPKDAISVLLEFLAGCVLCLQDAGPEALVGLFRQTHSGPAARRSGAPQVQERHPAEKHHRRCSQPGLGSHSAAQTMLCC
nr:unnamed protein product [Rangifer tarandus platyrhynchus]